MLGYKLILDQNVKIEALSLEVRRLTQAVETTEVVMVDHQRLTIAEIEHRVKTPLPRGPHNDN
jgi:hypothetical protein